MKIFHKELARGRWFNLSFAEQMANLGSEVERTISWKKRSAEYGQNAFFRGLELLDLTISGSKNGTKLKELCRLREILADYFYFDNEYRSTNKSWHNYFFPFNYAVRRNY